MLTKLPKELQKKDYQTPLKLHNIDYTVTNTRIASDLHLEQFMNPNVVNQVNKVLEPHEKDSESVLILAGDISSKFLNLIEILEYVSTKFKYVIFVPGNHEYYGYVRDVWDIDLINSTKHLENVFVAGYYTAVVNFNNVRFICNTMWADGGLTPSEMINVNKMLRDFHVITESLDYPLEAEIKSFTSRDMKSLNESHIYSFQAALSQPRDVPTIMVTHHMPLRELCHPRFGDTINGGFACDAGKSLSANYDIHAWIFGHTHDTIERVIDNVLYVSNPRGYASEIKYDPSFQFMNQYGYCNLEL